MSLKPFLKSTYPLSAIHFPEATKNLLKPDSMTDEECSSLWVFNDGEQCVSCWKLSWKERLNILLYGKLWLGILSGRTQPPVWIVVGDTVFTKEETHEEK